MLSSSFTSNEYKLVMIGGKSGIGKTETINALIKSYPDHYKRPVSVTTRLARNEDEKNGSEYVFVDPAEFMRLIESDELVNSDYVYGNWYGILRGSIEECVASGYMPIKEIHPANHEKIALALGAVISVLLERDCEKNAFAERDGRQVQDATNFDRTEKLDFDLIAKIVEGCVNKTAEELHVALQTLKKYQKRYPSRREIDTKNRYGYNLIASEFSDTLRLTTRNFHDASNDFFREEIELLAHGVNCLEIGPGNGWLRSEFNWPLVDYQCVDLSDEMTSGDDRCKVSISASCLPFATEEMDVVLASLADPFLYPSAIIEIRRVLKKGGSALISTPAHAWAKALRAPDSIDMTTFTLANGSTSTVFSFTRGLEEVQGIFLSAGMQLLKCQVIKVRDVTFSSLISPALTQAATNANVALDEMEIMHCMAFVK